jgi:signal transduction histidine kinase
LTRFTRFRLDPPSWLKRRTRRTARLRLTVLSGALFLLSGATLLAVAYLLFDQQSQSAQVESQHGELRVAPAPASGRGSAYTGSGQAQSHQSISHAARVAATAQVALDKHNLLVAFILALAIVAAAAILLGWFVAGRTLRPVRTITATARRISATNLHERLALRDADEEFKELGDTLDDLFARLAAAFEAQRHFVANASHELRTPLTAERALLQVALDDPETTEETWRSTAREVLASNDEQERLIEALLALASSEGGLDHREPVDLSATCEGALRRTDRAVQRFGLHVETVLDPAPLDGDPRLVERLVANLLDNAVGHNVAGGRVRVTTRVVGRKAVLSVVNTGPVVPLADVDRLFEPFQRLDPQRTHHRDGHGLGLSIVRAIASAHGATVTARPLPQGGLSVDVAFPAAAGSRPGLDDVVARRRRSTEDGVPAGTVTEAAPSPQADSSPSSGPASPNRSPVPS